MSKRFTLKTLVVMCLLLSFASAVMAAVKFNDVKSGHWAEDSIGWGVEEGIVEGYPDDTFKPNNAVTVAEFLKMLIASYDVEVPKAAEGEKWFDPYFNIAVENKWAGFTEGVHDEQANKAIPRGEVARVIASADGKLFPIVDDAILYLYEKGYSSGKKAKTVEGFAAKDTLTRAEAIKFINNFADLRASDKLVVAEVQKTNSPMKSVEDFVTQMEYVAKTYGFEIVLQSVEGVYANVNLTSDKWGTTAISLSYYADTNGVSTVAGSFDSDINDEKIIRDIFKGFTDGQIQIVDGKVQSETLKNGVRISSLSPSEKLNFNMVRYQP